MALRASRTRGAARAIAAALALLWSARAAAVRADERPRLVVLGGREDSAVTQLRAELRAIGFDVVADEQAAGIGRDRLEEAAQRASAVAAIRLQRSRSGVEVWIVDRVTGKLVLREVMSAELAGGGDRTLVLRVVELLRASFLEVDAPHASRGEVPATAGLRRAADLPPAPKLVAPPELEATAREPVAPPIPPMFAGGPSAEPSTNPLRPSLELGPAILVTPGGLSLALRGLLTLSLDAGRFGATAWTLLPAVTQQLRGAEGVADVLLSLIAAGGRVALGPRLGPWSARLGAGAALAWIEAQGFPARSVYVGHVDTTVLAGPYASVGAAYAVASFVSVHAGVTGGLLLRPQHVLLAERTVETLGPTFVTASLGLSFGDVNRGESLPRLNPRGETR